MNSSAAIAAAAAVLIPLGTALQRAPSATPLVTRQQSIGAFLIALESAVERRDRAAIAGMVHYPIKVLASGWIIPADNPAAFIKYYDAFFTEEIKDLIAEASSRPQTVKPNEVFTLGKNAVRIMRIGPSYKIIGLAIPPAAGKVRGARRGTTIVAFPTGRSTANFAGTLAAGEHEAYVVSARRNELLDVRVDGVRGRDIVARIVDAVTGTPLDDRARDGSRVWVGRVAASGDYRIDVVRLRGDGDAVLTYALAVSIR
jgi:hypothetical protein